MSVRADVSWVDELVRSLGRRAPGRPTFPSDRHDTQCAFDLFDPETAFGIVALMREGEHSFRDVAKTVGCSVGHAHAVWGRYQTDPGAALWSLARRGFLC
jgi:hypothetical protein